MYLRSIEIRQLRALKHIELDFIYPERLRDTAFADQAEWPPRLNNVNLLIGGNGSGKSTVLDAIALAILAPIITQSGYVPYSLVRRTPEGIEPAASVEADLILHVQDSAAPQVGNNRIRSETKIERRVDTEILRGSDESNPIWDGMYSESSPSFLLLGYGATRRVEAVSATDLASRRKQRLPRFERVASLFEDHFALMPIATWLPEMQNSNHGRYKQVMNILNGLLPNGMKLTDSLEGGEYVFEHRKTRFPYSGLSDGYRAYLGWIGDMLYHIAMTCPSGKKLVDTKGVVLIDEIDLHIHPDWQRTMIPKIARKLPNLQFVLTSHSPLVVGSLERCNIYQFKWGRGSQPSARRPAEEVYGLTADQILRSDVFGLESTRDPEFRKGLLELSSQASAGSDGAAVELMHKLAHGNGMVAEARADRVPEWLGQFGADRSSEIG